MPIKRNIRAITGKSNNIRRVLFEQLEERYCLAFDLYEDAPGTLIVHGSNNDDYLMGMHYQTAFIGPPLYQILVGKVTIVTASGANGEWGDPIGSHNYLDALPSAAAPLTIIIKGYKGNDVVEFHDDFTGLGSLSGFPPSSIAKIVFYGDEGNDKMDTVFGASFPAPSPISPVAPGALPNIKFYGWTGKDELVGGDLPELFQGGPGINLAHGGNGNDWLRGGQDIDILKGEAGNDRLIGMEDKDYLFGGPGRDVISGETGDDEIVGGDGNDEIYGGPDDDIIKGDAGDDKIFGEEGSDTISGGTGDDTLNTGTSTVANSRLPDDFEDDPDWLNVPTNGYFEIAVGNDGWDSIDASLAGGRTYLDGGEGQDTIHGGSFSDEIYGGPDNDWLFANGAIGGDTIYGEGGDDWIEGAGGWGTHDGGDDNDDIWGGGGPDTIFGGAGDDIIYSAPSNANGGPVDQPWNGFGPNYDLGWPDMGQSGEGGCDLVDFHEDNPNGCNRRPSIDGGYTNISVNEWINFPLYANSAWTASLVNGATFGNLVLHADGYVWYAPPPNWSGLDSFSYQVNDGQQDSNVVTFTFKVGDWDIAPPAKGFTVPFPPAGTPSQLNVSAPGLLDGLEDSTAINVVDDADHGSLDWNPDGSFTYTPAEGFVGTDSFYYVGLDANGEPNTEPLLVEIEVPDYSTRGYEDSYESGPGGTLSDDAPGVLWNDSWADTAEIVTPPSPSEGELTLNANGSFSFVPAVGFSGTATFTYKAIDSVTLHQSAPSTVTIYVSPIDANDDEYSMPLSAISLEITDDGVLDNDTGADTVELIEDDGPAFGTVELDTDGTFIYTPPSGFIGTDFFSYYAINTTTGARSIPISVTIRVGPHAGDDTYSIAADAPLNISVIDLLDNDNDVDSIELVEGSGPINGTLIDNQDGTFTYTPTPNYVGDDSFLYTAFDSTTNEQSPPALVTIHVIRPTANSDTYSLVATGSPLTINAPGVLSNDTSEDSAELVSSVSGDAGSLVFNSNGSFVYTPANGFTGDAVFQYRVYNEAIEAWSAPATVTIAVHRPPIAVNDNYNLLSETTLSIAAPGLLSNDQWATSFQITTPVSNGQLQINTDGLGSLRYTPGIGFAGTASFQYVATSAYGTSQPATVTFTVASRPIGIADSYSVFASDSLNVPASGVLSNDRFVATAERVAGTGPLGSLTFNANGSFTYQPPPGFAGNDTFQYFAIDSSGTRSDPTTVTISVQAPPPIATSDEFWQMDAALNGNPWWFDVTSPGVLANDEYADSWDVFDPNSQSWVSIVNETIMLGQRLLLRPDGSFSYTPNPVIPSGFDIQLSYRAVNTLTGQRSAPTTLDIHIRGWKPVAVNDEFEITQGLPFAASILSNDKWVRYSTGGGAMPMPLLTDFSQPSNGTLQFLGGNVVYVPNAGFIGEDSFQYRLSHDLRGLWSGTSPMIYFSEFATVTLQVSDLIPQAADIELLEIPEEPSVVPLVWNGSWADSVEIVTGFEPAQGEVAVNSDGSITYTPDPTFDGDDTFQYVTINSVSGRQSLPATITVFRPVIAQPDNYSTVLNQVLDISSPGLLINDQGANTAEFVEGGGPYFGTVVLNSDGSFTYTPSSGFAGTDTFQYRAIHAGSERFSDACVVTIEVIDNTFRAVDDDYWILVNETLELPQPGVLANDFQATGAVLISGPSIGSVTFNSDGSFIYVPESGFTGTVTFTYKALKDEEESEEATVTIHILEE